MHAGLTDNFLNHFMDGELFSDRLGGLDGRSFGSFFSGCFLGLSFGILRVVKDIESKSLFFGKGLVDEEVVSRSSLSELDNLLSSFVNVSSFIISIFNLV